MLAVGYFWALGALQLTQSSVLFTIVDDEPELVQGVAATAALALQAERLQAELRNQYEFLITLVDTAPSLLITVDLEGRILNQNVAVLEASGYDDEELVRGLFFWDVFGDPENRDEMRRAFEAAAPEFAPSEYENAFTNERRVPRVIAWTSAPVGDEGEILSIVAGGIDITERKHQEVELRSNEERLRAVIESSPVAIVDVDLENRVLTWNPGAERTFGWAAEEVVGSRVPVIGPEHERSRASSTRAFAPEPSVRVSRPLAAARTPTSTSRWRRRPSAAATGTWSASSRCTWTSPSASNARSSCSVSGTQGSAADGVPAVERMSRWRRANGESVVVEWTATPMPDPSADARRLVLISATDVTGRAQHEEEIRASRTRIVQAAV